jgi:hypothetical protein
MQKEKISFRHIFILTVMLTAALSLTACGKLMEYGSTNSNSNSNAKQAASPAIADKANTAASPAAESVPAGPVLASTDGDKPGIRVEVVELKRTSGETVNLKFTMINDSDKDMSFGYDFGEGSTTDISTIAGTHLIDAAGKKKYFVVRDTENACLCSRGLASIKPQTRANLFAKFPAPPDDVQKITVVIPHFTPMDDVPISR